MSRACGSLRMVQAGQSQLGIVTMVHLSFTSEIIVLCHVLTAHQSLSALLTAKKADDLTDHQVFSSCNRDDCNAVKDCNRCDVNNRQNNCRDCMSEQSWY